MDCKSTRINDNFPLAAQAKPVEPLFDAFLFSDEFTILYGPSGSGKSLLAVQIAEALARRQQIWNFEMPERARKVLYVDLVMSKAQFTRRYTSPERYRRPREREYKFSNNMFEARPGDLDGFDEWLRKNIETEGYEVIIIDDLAALRRAVETPRALARSIRHLKSICNDTGVTILLLSTIEKSDERAAVRRQMIFDAADSIFAIGVDAKNNGERYLVQRRVRNRPMVWNEANAPRASIARSDGGFIGFEFDHRTGPQLSAGSRGMICGLKKMADEGRSYRQISLDTGISYSKVGRLIKKWTPFLQQEEDEERAAVAVAEAGAGAGECVAGSAAVAAAAANRVEEEPDEFDEAGIERPPWLDVEKNGNAIASEENTLTTNEHEITRTDTNGESRQIKDPTQIPFAAALRRRTIYDLEHKLDEYGKDIYVAQTCEITGRPIVWYYFDNLGVLIKKTRSLWGSTGQRLTKTIYLDDG